MKLNSHLIHLLTMTEKEMLYRCTHLIDSFLSLSQKIGTVKFCPQHLFEDNQPKFPKTMALAQCTSLHPPFPLAPRRQPGPSVRDLTSNRSPPVTPTQPQNQGSPLSTMCHTYLGHSLLIYDISYSSPQERE